MIKMIENPQAHIKKYQTINYLIIKEIIYTCVDVEVMAGGRIIAWIIAGTDRM